MKVEMLMPQLGESITEATVSKWLKKAGDRVEKDETILEISTDKVDSEIPAPASGVLVEILFKEGDVVPVKSRIAVIDTEGLAASKEKAEKKAEPQAAVPKPAPEKEKAESGASRFYSPLVMSLAEKHGVKLSELEGIEGGGEAGRITKKDLLAYIETRDKGAVAAATQSGPMPALRSELAPPGPSAEFDARGFKTIPMDAMRQAIASHMVMSKQTSPHVYSIQEVDVSEIAKWRQKRRTEFEGKEGFKLSFTPFFLDAAVRALIKYPLVNSSVDGKNIILKKHVNLGCAVALGDPQKGFGLIVPVIRNAEEKSLVGLARALNDLASRARAKKLLPDDVAGGTFSVTNPGVFGTMIGTPIINQPQAAILCLGAISKRPVVIEDMIAIREMCYLTLSYDHRVIDGALAGTFLSDIKRQLESWDPQRGLE